MRNIVVMTCKAYNAITLNEHSMFLNLSQNRAAKDLDSIGDFRFDIAATKQLHKIWQTQPDWLTKILYTHL